MRAASFGLLSIFAGGCLQASAIDQQAQAVVDRSRSPTSPYSVFTWNEANTSNRGRLSEWGAEFHRGRLHRVETPLFRLVADCGKGTGTVLEIRTGRLVSNEQVAQTACGVDSTISVAAMRFLGRESGRFGKVDRIEITVEDGGIRTYDIDPVGAIVAQTIKGSDGADYLAMEATALLPSADGDIFTEASLRRSAVPEKYRKKPSGTPN